jgi:4-hydroxythreonine-4-phosphate dehydrogenase
MDGVDSRHLLRSEFRPQDASEVGTDGEAVSFRRERAMKAGERPLTLALTPGEPAGIGPDLIAKLARHRIDARVVIVADRKLLRERALRQGIDIHLADYGDPAAAEVSGLQVLHVPTACEVAPGKLDARNSVYVLKTLERAADGCLRGEFDAMVTGPVHKGIINEAGIAFTGHTEFLAERTGTRTVVMMLVGGGLRVALATTHLALQDVPGRITASELERTLRVLAGDLTRRYRIAQPRVGVAGLNPHAGESGYLGREEIDVITPVIEGLRSEGMSLSGPIPADTLFIPERLAQFDAVLAMYHDQGLPVLKYASFGAGINVTLGLPIIRTSVDHGTALDLAGSGKGDEGSLLAALEHAISMVRGSGHDTKQAAGSEA